MINIDMQPQNYYIAKLYIRNCFADVRINDVPVLRMDVADEVSANYPINYLIESCGEQSLMAQISPMAGNLAFGEDAACEVEIWRCDGNNTNIVPLENVCAVSLAAGDDELNVPLRKTLQSFPAYVAYEIDRWRNCEVLKNSKELTMKIAAYFKNVAEILSARRYEEYMQLVNERETNICTALGLDVNEVRLRNSMLFDALEDGFEICPLKGNKYVEFYANGKLVTILDKDMNSALRFQNPETGDILILDMLLGIKNSELCIV